VSEVRERMYEADGIGSSYLFRVDEDVVENIFSEAVTIEASSYADLHSGNWSKRIIAAQSSFL
ncbi:unnamed protein product, partial [Closterium sp. NIES-54]